MYGALLAGYGHPSWFRARTASLTASALLSLADCILASMFCLHPMRTILLNSNNLLEDSRLHFTLLAPQTVAHKEYAATHA